jgi:flagellar basal-body rod protein FlgB
MAIGFAQALGIHEQAMNLRSDRAALLANNLVNVDTPNFKARDLDFRSVLQNSMQNTTASGGLELTNSRHMRLENDGESEGLMYRTPLQPSLDGNTVDEQLELAEFTKNGIDFQASLTFLSSKFSGLSKAIKGEV